MAKIGQNWPKNGQKWPKFPKLEFSQGNEWSFPVSNHITQLNTKNYENLMRGFGEIAKNGHFWPKMSIFDQKLAKMAKF